MIPYVVMAGTLLVALAAPFFMGWDDMWFVPLVVLPFLILYFLVDRQLAAQEKRTGGGGH